MSEQPIIVFDVNETLLDLETPRPTFDRIFNDPGAMQLIARYAVSANVMDSATR
jgi:FMN phosphatase YigB (HAD superfamily)